MDGALFDDEEDEASANIQADRMFTALCRFGWHRAAELPSIARMHQHSPEEAIKLSAHYLCQCAAQVAPVADKWPVVLAASAAVADSGSKPPKPMQSLRVRERIEKKARHDLLRVHQLHALHAFVLRQPAMAAACDVAGDVGGVGGVSSSSALGGSAREAEVRCVQLLLDSESASSAAGWASSLLGRACVALQPLLDDVKGAPPAPAWGAQHDARLLVGVYLHGWGHYDLLRKHDALWQFATALEEGADADAAAAGGAWGGGAWPETKILERRVNALFKRVPGAAPPKELGSGGGGGGEGGEGASSRADAKEGSAGGGAKRKRKVEKVQPEEEEDDDDEDEDEEDDEEDEDHPYKPVKKASVKKEPSLKKAVGAKKATGGASGAGASSTGAGERSERAGAGGAAGGGKAPTREPTREEMASEREAARKDLTDLLLAFGLPTSEDDWERVRQHATTASLKKSPAEALRKGGERLAKEWELDAKSKNEETSREAKQRLTRLDIVATLRRFIDRQSRPDVGAPSLEKEDPMPSWWQPPTHDVALVHGVLKHGFPKGTEGWKSIYSDLEVFASPAAKASPPSKMASLKRLKRIHLAMTPSKAVAPKTAPKALKQPPAWMLAPPPASAAAQRAAKEAAAAAATALAAKEAADAGVSGGGAAAPAAVAGGSSGAGAGPAAAPTTAPSGPVTVATLSSLSRVGVPLSDALESSRSHKPAPEGAKPSSAKPAPEDAKSKNKPPPAAAPIAAGAASSPPPAPPPAPPPTLKPAPKPAPKPAASTSRPVSAWQKPAEPTLPPQPWQKAGAVAAPAAAPAAARAAAAQESDEDDDVPLAARAR